jgi:guanylate kinase
MLIAFSGPSGAGKSFMVGMLVRELGFNRVRILTTRQPRDGEAAADKEFVSVKDIEKLRKAGEIFYDFDFLGNTYAFRSSDILSNQNTVFETPPEVVPDWKRLCPEIKVIYLMPKNIADVEAKIRKRETNPAIIKERMDETREQIRRFKSDKRQCGMFDHVVETEYNEATTDAVLRIVHKLVGKFAGYNT